MHPREFGNFRILQLLPKGGMGTVYLAENLLDNKRVALKLIELGPDLDRQEIAAAERRGANLQKQICGIDKRITNIRDFGELDGFFFIEMEYVEGQDLSELLRAGPLGVRFAARIGLDLSEVLAITHNFHAVIDGQSYRGIVHGDIKPRNIRITPDGELRVLDFGIAKALSLTRSFTQIQFGSSQYSSPERLRSGEITVDSDLWAVGVVLWEVVTAKPFFQAENGPRLEHLIRTYRAVPPIPEQFPKAFAAILRKALHADPAQRYRAASEFGADLRAFLEGRKTVAETMPAAAVPIAFDNDATRRTAVPVAEVDDATRRTQQPPRPTPIEKVLPKNRTYSVSRNARQVIGFSLLAIVLSFSWFVLHEINVWRKGDELARQLETERIKDLNVAFVRYQELQNETHIPLVLHGPRRAMTEKLLASADRIILEFREAEAPTITEQDWIAAEAALSKALQLSPSDKEIRGKIYLCQAHIARIKGRSRLSGKLLNESRTKFEQAHNFMTKSPDPFIGLATLYAYSLNDVDRARDAVEQATRRGHKRGRREKALLADAHQRRAERLMREAVRAEGYPEEKDFLERASTDLEKAQDLYRDIVPFGGATASLRRAIESTDLVAIRLRAIREGA
ncbi:MAG: protein kinase [Bryobacteraceae bacterium]|nr:protein kinase [Bryobacteraceae bacterium]